MATDEANADIELAKVTRKLRDVTEGLEGVPKRQRREDMDSLHRAVSDTLDEYLDRLHGVNSSHTYPEDFLEWLGNNGYKAVKNLDHCDNLEHMHSEPVRDIGEECFCSCNKEA